MTSYQSIKSGKYKIIVKSVINFVETLILSKNITFKAGMTNTLLIFGGPNNPNYPNYNINKFNDVSNCPNTTYANITFTNTLFNTRNIDVYINGETTPSIKNLEPYKSENLNVKISQISLDNTDTISFRIKSSNTTITTTTITTTTDIKSVLSSLYSIYAINRGLYTIVVSDYVTRVFHNNRGKCQSYQKKFMYTKIYGKMVQN